MDLDAPAQAADYRLSGTTLTIPAGERTSTGTVTIAAVDNAVDAPDKTVSVSGTARNAEGVTGPGPVTLTIKDDDETPTVALALSRSSISENGGTAAVTARLDRASSAPTVVTVAASPDAPAQAADYRLSGTTLTIPAGERTSTGTVIPACEADDQGRHLAGQSSLHQALQSNAQALEDGTLSRPSTTGWRSPTRRCRCRERRATRRG